MRDWYILRKNDKIIYCGPRGEKALKLIPHSLARDGQYDLTTFSYREDEEIGNIKHIKGAFKVYMGGSNELGGKESSLIPKKDLEIILAIQ